MTGTNRANSAVEAVEHEMKQVQNRVKPQRPEFPNLLSYTAVRHFLHALELWVWSCILNLACIQWIVVQVQKTLIRVLQVGPLPKHVSFIMDGNRRYAKSLSMPTKSGHEAGAVTLLNLLAACKSIGIKTVSAYAFSIENFNRPREEVDVLTSLLAEKLDEVAHRAQDRNSELYGLRLCVIGERSMISKNLNDKITRVERMTDAGESMILYICFPYTSRNDIYHAVYDAAEGCKYHGQRAADIDVQNFTKRMFLGDYANKCDLLIRTSGHTRLSDYMLWQVHENGVVEFTNTLWPDFSFIEFFSMLLKWSFFTSLQRRQLAKVSLRSQTMHFLKDNLLPFKRKQISYEDLPEAPQSVSVVLRQ
ncbi:LANO_0D07074g1_1 [Lachancea nothofagi CBS 11611]|uniref:Alkyl transferase n=1 Tax=Lachancea nothofagi CBS 11611 TaxID=1266666 RepID=A0A1G4JI66_9SACH|nr:LANO_0D07074g1_1 [Lachancea nothofagi CBS 11611]